MQPTSKTANFTSQTNTNIQSHHMKELQKSLAPNGVFGQFLSSGKYDSVDSRTTLGALTYLYRGDFKEEFNAFATEYERIKMIVNQTARSPEEKTKMFTELSMAVTNAVLDSGKLEPALTGLLRFTVNSKADFASKCKKMSIVNEMFSLLDPSMVRAAKLDLHERLSALNAFTFRENFNLNTTRENYKSKLEISMQQIFEELNLGIEEDSEGFLFEFAYKVVNARIADTCEPQFAKNYGKIMSSSDWEGKLRIFVQDTFSESTSAKPAEPLLASKTSESMSRAEMAQNNTWQGSPIPPQTVITATANVPYNPYLATPITPVLAQPLNMASQYAPVQQQQQPAVITTTNTPFNPYLTTSMMPMNMPMQASNMVSQNASMAAPSPGEKLLMNFGYPLNMQRQDLRFANVAKKLDIFYEKCSPKPGSNRERLLRDHPQLLMDMVNSMEVLSIQGDVNVRQLAFNRNILPEADRTLNNQLIGNEDGYAEQYPESLTPGAQVAIGLKIPMYLLNGQMVRPHVLSVAAPSLAKDQGPNAEINKYIKKGGTLSTKLYRAARKGMSDRILAYARALEKKPQQVVLSASGMGHFLSGLDDVAKKKAQKIAVEEMVELVKNLRANGQTVSFTDKTANSEFWKQVSDKLGKNKGVNFAGTVPGNWMGDNDLIVNSTSSIDQPGNGGAVGNSLDGQFGDTLMFDAHILRAIMESEKMMQN